MKKEAGILNVLLIPVVVLGLLAAGLIGFGAWSYQKYQDYKNNTDQKISVAVIQAKDQQKQQLQAQFVEQEKQPTRQFTGPAALGSVAFKYPKTWSVYIGNDGQNGGQFDAYLNPGQVLPAQSDLQHPSALHVIISQQDYNSILSAYTGMVSQGKLTATPIKLKQGTGMRFDGTFSDVGLEGSQIVFPLRDKTVQVFAEAQEHVNDFNSIIVPSLTYIP